MVSKEVFKRIGVFAVAAMVAVSPVLAVNATGNAGIQLLAADGVTSDTSDPQPQPSQTSPAQSSSQSYRANVVTTAEGTKLVSTVPGECYVLAVDGVAVRTPRTEVKEAFGAAAGDSVSMNFVDTKCGKLARQSIADGVALLAANKIQVEEGPVVDVNAFLNDKKVTDIDTPITISLGIPASFREEGCEYAVILVQEGGSVSILTNQSEDPSVLTVETKGFGVYAIVKAPAGSFDIYK